MRPEGAADGLRNGCPAGRPETGLAPDIAPGGFSAAIPYGVAGGGSFCPKGLKADTLSVRISGGHAANLPGLLSKYPRAFLSHVCFFPMARVCPPESGRTHGRFCPFERADADRQGVSSRRLRPMWLKGDFREVGVPQRCAISRRVPHRLASEQMCRMLSGTMATTGIGVGISAPQGRHTVSRDDRRKSVHKIVHGPNGTGRYNRVRSAIFTRGIARISGRFDT
jgi:hypothetical protein